MSDKNTTPKLPKYKKTIDTTGFGLSCTTEYGFDDEGWFHHAYTYTYKNRKAIVSAVGNGEPLPADWHTRQSAYASYYEDGKRVGRTRAYNILGNAQIKAVRWAMGYGSDSKADEAYRAIRLEKSRRNRQTCNRIPEALRMEVDRLADKLGLKIHGDEDNSTVETFVNTYLATAEQNGLIELRERQYGYEKSMTVWLDGDASRKTEDAPDWEKFKETVVEIVPLYLECRRKTAESVGLGEKLAEN